MARWQRARTHELDNLSTQQYHEIANGHDTVGWESQRQGFTELRDLTDDLAQRCDQALTELRETWTGGGAEAFTAEVRGLIAVLSRLRDSSATNADGMREMAAVIESTRAEADQLNDEDTSWRSNPDGDDARTVTAMRESVRTELRDKIKEADESFQHLAQSYLVEPPESPRLGGMGITALDTVSAPVSSAATPSAPADSPGPHVHRPAPAEPASPTSAADAPSLQNPPAHGAAPPPVEPAPPPAPVTEAPPPSAGPMMPMSGMGMGGGVGTGADSGGGNTRSEGPRFGEGRPVEPSRMRSSASRQELHNRSQHGQYQHSDPTEQRRSVNSEDPHSPFMPADEPVVPPVISGGVPHTGPHDSGPVLTGTVYRHYPDFGLPDESSEVITEEYEDGSSAEIQYDVDDAPAVTTQPTPEDPPPDATTRAETAEAALEKRLYNTRVDGEEYLRIYQGLPREKAVEFAAAQRALRKIEPEETPDETPAEPREQTNLDEQRRRRHERRDARRK